jgi:hypothetical protein
MPTSVPSRPLYLTWSKQDGIKLGDELVLSMTQASIDRNHDDMATIVNKLRDLLLAVDCVQGVDTFLSEFPMFPHVLAPVVKHTHKQFPVYVTKQLLRELTEPEAVCIGSALSKSIFFRQTGVDAVAEWIGKYPALRQFKAENVWFEPMVRVIAQHLAQSSRRGAIFRLLIGVVISASDLGSDVYMVAVYLSTAGLTNFGWALFGMLAASMLFGLLLVYFQDRKKSKREFAKECMYVMLGLMPGVLAYKVAKAKKQDKNELLDSKLELAATKGIEMFAEGSKLRDA